MKNGFCLFASERSGSTYVSRVLDHYLQRKYGFGPAPYEPFNIEASATWHGPGRQPYYEIGKEEAEALGLRVPYFIFKDANMTEVWVKHPLPKESFASERMRRLCLMASMDFKIFFKVFGVHINADPERMVPFLAHNFNIIALERDWLEEILSSMLTSYSGIYHSQTPVQYAVKFTAKEDLFRLRADNLLMRERLKKRLPIWKTLRYEDVESDWRKILTGCGFEDWPQVVDVTNLENSLPKKVNPGDKLDCFTNPEEILWWYEQLQLEQYEEGIPLC